MQKTTNTYKNTSPAVGPNLLKRKGHQVQPQRNKAKGGFAINTFGMASIAIPKDKFSMDVWGLSEIHKPLIEVYDDLFPAYRNYLNLVGEEMLVKEDNSISENINCMYRHILKISEKEYKHANVSILFDGETQEHKMCITGYYHGAGDIVYAIPLYAIKILEKKNNLLFNCLCDLMHWLYEQIGFQHWNNCELMSYIPESLLNTINYEEVDEENAMSLVNIIGVYSESKSEANKTLRDITKCRNSDLNKIMNDLQRVKCKKHQKFLKNWAIAGVKLLSESGAKNVNNFQNDDEFDNDYNEDGNPIRVEDCFVFNWFPQDHLLHEYLDWLGQHSNEFGSYSACSYLMVDKNTNQIYKHDDWYVRFIDWLQKGITALESFAEKMVIEIK